jgi:hypothetical protein
MKRKRKIEFFEMEKTMVINHDFLKAILFKHEYVLEDII